MTKAHKSVLDGVVETVVPGSSLIVNNADPKNPIINARLANQATAEAGTDNTQLMTALSVAQSIAKNSPPTDTSALALALADLQGSRLVMKGGVADPFDDETGVNGGNVSYSSPGGMGNRSTMITATTDLVAAGGSSGTFQLVVDGNTANNTYFWSSQSVAGKLITFDFGTGGPYIITEARSYTNNGAADGIWQWRGSNNGTAWTNIGSPETLNGSGSLSATYAALAANTTAYRYYQLIGISGNIAGSNYQNEFEFKIGTSLGLSINQFYESALNLYRPQTLNTDTFTKLLIHADGPNGSSNIFDSSGYAVALNRVGVVTSTAQSKFGGSSMLFSTSSDFISISDNAEMELLGSDFTIECWIRTTTVAAGNGCIITKRPTQGETSSFEISRNGSQVQILMSSSTANGWDIILQSVGTLVANQWHHIAAVRNGTAIRMYLDGVQIATATSSATAKNDSGPWVIGRFIDGTGSFNGWIDEFRFTKGVARWTAPFTPPTAPYTDTASFQNMSLVSVPYATSPQPAYARLVLQIDTALTIVPNTDLQGQVSRDGGTTWATANLQLASTLGNVKTYQDDAVDLSGIGAGTNIVWRARTLTNKNIPISGVVTQWR